jgi:RNA polymerase sigma-70 factor (ECF subfamily)
VNYSILDDEVLIALITHAQTEALSALYDRYSRLVYSLALYVLGDPASAEEVTQDVFFRVWEKAGTYRAEQAKVSTWLTSITRNRAIDMLRRRGARPEGHSLGWEELALQALPKTDGRLPEDRAAQAIQSERVRAAISSLPTEQQRALALAFFEGLSHNEIANRLGQPLGTVKTRIRMAMQKLRSLLHEEQVSS